MAKKKRSIWLYLLIGVVLLLVVLVALKSGNKPKGEPVELEAAELRTIREKVVASGKVFPEAEVKISSDVSGEIVELHVKEGDSVRAGQLLARINPDTYVSAVDRGVASVNSSKSQKSMSQAQLQNSIASREQIEAQLVNQRAIHKRNEGLRKEGVISEADFEASEASLRSLEANLRAAAAGVRSAESNVESADYAIRSAEASLKELRTSLQRTSIYAPTDGIVSKLNVEKGERVVGTIQMTGTEMMRIANMNSMEVQVEVSENDILRVKLGDEAEVEVDAYIGRKFKGVVTQIANSANGLVSAAGTTSLTTDQVTNFIVKIRIDASSYRDLIDSTGRHAFRPGMSASVAITTAIEENVLCVPIQSVTTRDLKAVAGKTDDKAQSGSLDDDDDDDGPGAVAQQDTTRQKNRDEDIREVVFVAEADTVRMAVVTIGIQDDYYIRVTSGLNPGDKVVTGPYTAISRRLASGAKVRSSDNKKAKDK